MSKCGYLCATAQVWKSKNSLPELAVSFHHVGPRTWTRVFRLVGKLLFSLTHFTSPYFKRLFNSFSMLTSACCVCCIHAVLLRTSVRLPQSPYRSLPGYSITFGCRVSSSWLWRFPNLFLIALKVVEGLFVVFCRHFFIRTARYLVHGVPGVVGFEGKTAVAKWRFPHFVLSQWFITVIPLAADLGRESEVLWVNCLFLFCAVVFGERPCPVHTQQQGAVFCLFDTYVY